MKRQCTYTTDRNKTKLMKTKLTGPVKGNEVQYKKLELKNKKQVTKNKVITIGTNSYEL